MVEKYVWKVTFETTEKDEDGDELCESREVIGPDFDAVYEWAKEQIDFDDGFTGIAIIKRISDPLEVI